jgi:hypothetical protein
MWCDDLTEIPYPHAGLIDLYFNGCQFNSILDLAFWNEVENITFLHSEFPCKEILNLTQFQIFSDNCFITTEKWTDIQTVTKISFPVSNKFVSTTPLVDNTSEFQDYTSEPFTNFSTIITPVDFKVMIPLISSFTVCFVIILFIMIFVLRKKRLCCFSGKNLQNRLPPSLNELEMYPVNNNPIYRGSYSTLDSFSSLDSFSQNSQENIYELPTME